MSLFLKIVAVLICFGMFFGLFHEMKKKRLSESSALLWLLGVIGLLVLSCFPGILNWVAGLLGIWWAPAALIFFALVVIILIIFFHTISISQLESQVLELSMQVALLKDQNEEMSHKLTDMNKGETA